MSLVRCTSLSVSLDGFVAGPNQSVDAPLGVGGDRLHEWAFETRSMRTLHGLDGGEEGIDNRWAERHETNVGATIMGRNMFGPIRGSWGDEPWRGWWGPEPPFHHPVFVLTHHARPPERMDGGTTFHFVTGGIHEALARAREAADGADVRVGGGAQTVCQYLDAALIDELHFAVIPVLLGSGERLFDGLPRLGEAYECVVTQQGERAVHVVLRKQDLSEDS